MKQDDTKKQIRVEIQNEIKSMANVITNASEKLRTASVIDHGPKKLPLSSSFAVFLADYKASNAK